MKCSLGISDFLEEISSLSHSIIFPYFFASPDIQYWSQIDYILSARDGKALYIQQKQDRELTVAQILMQNSLTFKC